MSSPRFPQSTSTDSEVDTTTRTGLRLRVRRADASDEATLSAFFENVSAEDLRFRFLSAVQHVGHDQVAAMLKSDDPRISSFLAVEQNGEFVGVATLASDMTGETAEVAVSVRRDRKAQGIGWSLLRHVAQIARAKGILRLQSIESRDNYAAIEVERELGFTARACPGDPTLILVEADLTGDSAPGT